MIVVEIKLASAISRERDKELGTLIIDNITDNSKHILLQGRVGDYRARMFPKGALKRAGGDARKMVHEAKAFREGCVRDHARLREPVGSLVAKALRSMNYNG